MEDDREYLLTPFPQNIAWYLDEKVVACIVRGVHEAVKTKQAQYTINTRNSAVMNY